MVALLAHTNAWLLYMQYGFIEECQFANAWANFSSKIIKQVFVDCEIGFESPVVQTELLD